MKTKKLIIITVSKSSVPKDVGNSLKHEIDSIIKRNQFLVEHTIKNEITLLLFKYKRGNDIYEHEKQWNEGILQICS